MLKTILAGWRRFAEAVAALLLATIFLAFLVQIAMRYVFNAPLGWTTELSLAAWLWLVLWGSAFVVREHEEIRLDLLLGSVGRRLRRLLAALGHLGLGSLFALSLPATYDYVQFMQIERSGYLKIPLNLLYSIYLVFAMSVVLHCAWRLLLIMRGHDPMHLPSEEDTPIDVR